MWPNFFSGGLIFLAGLAQGVLAGYGSHELSKFFTPSERQKIHREKFKKIGNSATGKSVYDIPVNVLTLVRKIYALIIVVNRVVVVHGMCIEGKDGGGPAVLGLGGGSCQAGHNHNVVKVRSISKMRIPKLLLQLNIILGIGF